VTAAAVIVVVDCSTTGDEEDVEWRELFKFVFGVALRLMLLLPFIGIFLCCNEETMLG
jgi:hypothetical protein